MVVNPTLETIAGAARATRRKHPQVNEAVHLRTLLLADYPQFRSKSPSSVHFACSTELRKEAWAATAEIIAPESLSIERSARSIVIDFPASQSVKTLAELLAATDVDPLEWEVERSIVNKWDTHAVIENNPVCLTNWQVKAWLKPVERITALTVAEIAKTLAPLVKRTGAAFRPKQADNSGDYLLELDIFDLHLGKLADPLETGQSYDLDIACALYEAAVDALIARAAGYPIGEVLLPVGNDFYNSDTKIGSTTAGTPQHEAARWQRTFVRGASLITATVNRLRERGLKVRLVMVPGNHDECNVFFLGQVLGATFADCPDVTIDNSFGTRKYVQFHDCGIMFTHGNAEKEANLSQIFAQEQPAMWAATRFRETHLAHVHHKKEFKYRTMGEQIGMTTRYMRSLSAVDAWHHWKGYVGSQRSAEGFVWAKGEGVVAHLTFTYTDQDLFPHAAVAA